MSVGESVEIAILVLGIAKSEPLNKRDNNVVEDQGQHIFIRSVLSTHVNIIGCRSNPSSRHQLGAYRFPFIGLTEV